MDMFKNPFEDPFSLSDYESRRNKELFKKKTEKKLRENLEKSGISLEEFKKISEERPSEERKIETGKIIEANSQLEEERGKSFSGLDPESAAEIVEERMKNNQKNLEDEINEMTS